MKIILRIFTFLFVIVFFLIGYLSLIGLKTERFNSQISQKIKKINGNFEIELKEIKIILDPFKFQLNAKTIGPKIINRNRNVIKYLKILFFIYFIKRLFQKFINITIQYFIWT